MNILEISNKASKEAYIPANEWPVASRIEDINTEHRLLKEEAGMIGSKYSIADSSPKYEDFTLVVGDNEFTRTIPNIGIRYVQYRQTSESDWEMMDHEDTPGKNQYWILDMRFTADEKKIQVLDAHAGFVRVTYERSATTDFTTADLDADPVPSPDWLPLEFRDLLWLGPVLMQMISEERRTVLTDRYTRIKDLFDLHYGRFATQNSEIEIDGGSNNRR